MRIELSNTVTTDSDVLNSTTSRIVEATLKNMRRHALAESQADQALIFNVVSRLAADLRIDYGSDPKRLVIINNLEDAVATKDAWYALETLVLALNTEMQEGAIAAYTDLITKGNSVPEGVQCVKMLGDALEPYAGVTFKQELHAFADAILLLSKI